MLIQDCLSSLSLRLSSSQSQTVPFWREPGGQQREVQAFQVEGLPSHRLVQAWLVPLPVMT